MCLDLCQAVPKDYQFPMQQSSFFNVTNVLQMEDKNQYIIE